MSPEELLNSNVGTLLALALLVWAAGAAISKIRRSNPDALVTHLKGEVADMQTIVRDLLMTARSGGMRITYGGDPSKAVTAAIGQDERALSGRLSGILHHAPGSWSPSDRGFVQNYASPERLALIFMGSPELAGMLLKYASAWFGRHRAFRRILKISLLGARDITSAQALATEAAPPDASSITGELATAGASSKRGG